jgi:hypothetical protein
MTDQHEHDWTWQHFVVQVLEFYPWHRGYGVRTCDCGSLEVVQADSGQTPQQTGRMAEVDARDEARKARRRAVNQRRKALQAQASS